MSEEKKIYHSSADHYDLLHDHGCAALLQVTKHEPFLAETAFINHWNTELDNHPNQDGLTSYTAYAEEGMVIAEFVYQRRDENEHIAMIYTPDPDQPSRHALMIIHNGNVVYQRRADQDPATEWEINCMADDPEITDDHGNMLFVGDPVNI